MWGGGGGICRRRASKRKDTKFPIYLSNSLGVVSCYSGNIKLKPYFQFRKCGRRFCSCFTAGFIHDAHTQFLLISRVLIIFLRCYERFQIYFRFKITCKNNCVRHPKKFKYVIVFKSQTEIQTLCSFELTQISFEELMNFNIRIS